MADGSAGRVTSVAVDPGDSSHWLAGAATGGIWETHDGGLTWTPRTDDQPTLASGALAFAPSDPKIVYVGTGEMGFSRDAYAGLGLLKSSDGGATWKLIQSPNLVRASFAALRVHPTDPNTLVAATTRGNAGRYTEPVPEPPEYGVLRSTDGGSTWTLMMSGEVTALDVDPTNFNNQYAAVGNPNRPSSPPAFPTSRENGIYRSMDGGKTWSPINGPWTSATTVLTGRVALAVAPSAPNTVYLSIENSCCAPGQNGLVQGLLGLFRTDNAWDPVPTWIKVPTEATGPQAYCGRQCGSAHNVAVNPSDPNTVIAGGQDLWRCNNCGASPKWTNIGTTVHPDHRVLFWRGARLISGNDGGVVSSIDAGDTWQNHNATLTIAQFFKGELHPTDPNVLMAGPKDNGCPLRWTGGAVWSAAGTAFHHVDTTFSAADGSCEGDIAISSSRPDTNWMGSAGFPLISRTLDGGQTAPGAVEGITESPAAITPPVRKCPRVDDGFLTGNNGLWRTDNFFSGATVSWTANAPSLGSQITGIGFAESDAACKTYAYGTAAGQIRLTKDGGKTWADLDRGKTLPARSVHALTFDPANPNMLYVGFAGLGTPGKPGHLFKTINALDSSPVWVDISPSADSPCEVITVDPANPKSVFLGTDAGVWHSSDAGATWQRMGPETGMPNVPVYDIRINPATKRAVAFTFGRGAFMLSGLGFDPPPAPIRITSAANGATYLAGGLVPGSWAQIQGTNLSTVRRTWTDADFVGLGNQLPTKLNGVEVKVNGVAAAVYYISPTQISFQFPSGTLSGAPGNILYSSPVTIQSFLNGVGSNVLMTTGSTSSPGIFPVIVNGKNYAAAVFTDGRFAGDPSLGPVFRNAKPGDVIELFATGLIRNQSGVVPNPQSFNGVTLKIGDVGFAADSATLVAPGEFQINFRVPQQFATLPEGDYPISVQFKLDDGNVTSSPSTINSDPPGPVVLPIQH
jgi:uncharacterized protein (TIGR03437 family)